MANCYSQNMYIMQQTFRELAHRWAEAKQPIVKYSTICAYRLALRTHLIPRFGSMVQIHEAEVQKFIVDKMRAGMAKKTVRDIVAILRAVVRYGARLHLCERENWQLAYPTTEQGRKLPVSCSPAQTHAIFGRATDFAQYRDIACALHGDAYRRGLCAGVGRCEFATPHPSRASNGGAHLRL